MVPNETDQLDQLAEALVDRLSHLTSSDDYQALDTPEKGYVLVPDASTDTLLVVLGQTNYETRRQQYGHDMSALISETLWETPAVFSTGDWIPARIPHNMKLRARGVRYGPERSAYILEISKIGQSGDMNNLSDRLHSRFERATMHSGLLPESDTGLLFDTADITFLEMTGFHAAVYTRQGQPEVTVALDTRRVLVDFLLNRPSPLTFMEQFLAQTDQTSFQFDRTGDIRAGTLGFQDDEMGRRETAVLLYSIRAPDGTGRPLPRLEQLRSAIIELLQQAGPSAAWSLDEMSDVASYLNQLPLESVRLLVEETRAIPPTDRLAFVSEFAAARKT